MKKILLTIGLGTLAIFASAQTVFNVDAPASIGGAYDFEYAEPAGTGGSSWGVLDLTDPANSIVDTLVLVDAIDTVDGGTPINDGELGCASLMNAADVAGKIAVVFRGECEFGFKAKNAQDAGAVGVIIINNIPGNPLGMLAGTFGAQVTIPTVMVSDLTGADLVNTMMTEDVVVFIGNKTGRFPNDLSINGNEVLRPKHTAIPQSLAQDASELEVKAGGWVKNFGFNTQYNVTLTYDITFGGSSVYNNFASVDSLETGDSAYISLPTFSQSTYANGEFDMNYTVTSDSTDNFPSDDIINVKLLVNNESIATGNVDATTGLPSTPADTYFWFLKSCMNFSHPFASRVNVNSITFSATSTNTDSLVGKFLEIRAYEWDGSDPNSMSDIASGEYDYNTNLKEENVTANFSAPFRLEDFKSYLFCVENNSGDTVYIGQSNIGYDLSIDTNQYFTNVYEQTDNSLATGFTNIKVTPAISIQTEAVDSDGDQVPDYVENTQGSNAGDIASFLDSDGDGVPDYVEGLQGTNPNDQNDFLDSNNDGQSDYYAAVSVGIDEEVEENLTAYPNPAKDMISIPVGNMEVSNVVIYDVAGKVVSTQDVSSTNTNLTLDVTSIPNGMYVIALVKSDNTTSKINVVVSK